MPHQRARHLLDHLKKQATLWPSLGIVGARQSGKTTLLRDLLRIHDYVSFDDEDLRDEAENSARVFINKRGTPLVLDEVQKVPPIFDAVKLLIDAKRVPGRYYLTGSTQFSAKGGIRESLTGRICVLRLYPFTCAEGRSLAFRPLRGTIHAEKKPRISVEDLASASLSGGMPVPMFMRDPAQRAAYWDGWLDTTIYRDLAIAYGARYRPEVARRILREMGDTLREAEWPSLRHFSLPARTLRRYLEAMELIFLVQRIPAHPGAVGGDCWMLLDSGLARHLMGTSDGEGPSLSLIRHTILNEIQAGLEYSGVRPLLSHYRTAKGAAVDLIDEDSSTAFRIIPHARHGRFGWEERPIAGAIRKLGLSKGYLVAPTSAISHPGAKGVGLLPWSYWS